MPGNVSHGEGASPPPCPPSCPARRPASAAPSSAPRTAFFHSGGVCEPTRSAPSHRAVLSRPPAPGSQHGPPLRPDPRGGARRGAAGHRGRADPDPCDFRPPVRPGQREAPVEPRSQPGGPARLRSPKAPRTRPERYPGGGAPRATCGRVREPGHASPLSGRGREAGPRGDPLGVSPLCAGGGGRPRSGTPPPAAAQKQRSSDSGGRPAGATRARHSCRRRPHVGRVMGDGAAARHSWRRRPGFMT